MSSAREHNLIPLLTELQDTLKGAPAELSLELSAARVVAYFLETAWPLSRESEFSGVAHAARLAAQHLQGVTGKHAALASRLAQVIVAADPEDAVLQKLQQDSSNQTGDGAAGRGAGRDAAGRDANRGATKFSNARVLADVFGDELTIFLEFKRDAAEPEAHTLVVSLAQLGELELVSINIAGELNEVCDNIQASLVTEPGAAELLSLEKLDRATAANWVLAGLESVDENDGAQLNDESLELLPLLEWRWLELEPADESSTELTADSSYHSHASLLDSLSTSQLTDAFLESSFLSNDLTKDQEKYAAWVAEWALSDWPGGAARISPQKTLVMIDDFVENFESIDADALEVLEAWMRWCASLLKLPEVALATILEAVASAPKQLD